MADGPNAEQAEEQRQARIAGTLWERDGYAQKGRSERVAECDRELERLGYVDPEDDEAKPKRGSKAKDGDA